MTEPTRRHFFKLAAGAAAMAAVPASVVNAMATVETIWCNGILDDAPAIAALMRGDTVGFRLPEMADHIGWRGDVLTLNGQFTIKSGVNVPHTMGGKTVRGGSFDLDIDSYSSFLGISGGSQVTFRETHLRYRNSKSGYGIQFYIPRRVRIHPSS